MKVYKKQHVGPSGVTARRSGRWGWEPCVRGLRTTVDDVPGGLAMGVTVDEVVPDVVYLTENDGRKCFSRVLARANRYSATDNKN